MRNLPIDPSNVPGWGIDANPENDPTYPMRDRSHEDKRGMSWERPPQQKETVEILQSIERNNLTAVFGTSTPPSGVSGMIRRQAFRYSESEWAHWLMLMAADRVNVVEGLVEDLGRGRVPNIPGEMGIRSELEHNRLGLMRKALVAGAVVGLGILAVRIASADRGGRRPGTRRG
ncbi:hypothetical protein [Methylorubrum extorquens]|jgi:hypothetical protein